MPFASDKIEYIRRSVDPGKEFTVPQQVTLRRLINDAQFCLRRAANPNERDQQRSVAIRKWFGPLDVLDIKKVLLYSQRMYAYSTNMQKFRFKSHNPNELGSVASFGQLAKHKVAGGILGRDGSLPHYTWANYINVTSLFFVQPHKTQVCSVLHELSHAWIGTKDLVLGSEEVYGEGMAVRVIIESPREVLTSAENWGYYLTEFDPTSH